VHDALIVRGFQSACHLPRHSQRLLQAHRPTCDTIRQILPLNQLQDQEVRIPIGLQPMYGADVGMIQ
jgi:hypothetical protein